MAELVKTLDIYNVIRRTMGCMDNEVMRHGEITAYIFYNMLMWASSRPDLRTKAA